MIKENIYYVYEHWRPDKGVCFYVGKGKRKRAWDLKNARNRWHMAVTSKLTSMGLMVDVRIVVSGLSSKAALGVEVDRIAMYGRENLTNLTKGGDGLSDPSVEVKKRISDAHKARYAAMTPEERREKVGRNVGVPVSEETREKLRISSTGRKHSPKAIENLKKAAKLRGVSEITRLANIKANTGRKRAPFKDSTIQKMQVASVERERRKKEKRLSNGTRYIHSKCRSVICLDDGNTFPSMATAAEHYGINVTTINQVCAGHKGRHTAGGKRFAYVVPETS